MTRRLAPWLAAIVLGASLVATAAPGLAHSPAARPPSVEARSDEPLRPEAPQAQDLRADVAGSPMPAALGVLALLLGTFVARRRARLAVSALAVLALAILTFENGLHSVHHLGDERGAAQCSVASATTHLVGATDDPSCGAEPVVVISENRAGGALAAPARAPFRRDAGRAPPRHTA